MQEHGKLPEGLTGNGEAMNDQKACRCNCNPHCDCECHSSELATLRTALTAEKFRADGLQNLLTVSNRAQEELRTALARAEAKIAELEARCAAQEKR